MATIILGSVMLLTLLLGMSGSAEVHEPAAPNPQSLDVMRQLSANFLGLGLTPQQSLGVMTSLLSNGLLSSNALRSPTAQLLPGPSLTNLQGIQNLAGQQSLQGLQSLQGFNSNLFNPSSHIDPYFLLLLSHYTKYLPYGLGAQGIYGSSGLPKVKPLGLFKHNDKN